MGHVKPIISPLGKYVTASLELHVTMLTLSLILTLTFNLTRNFTILTITLLT